MFAEISPGSEASLAPLKARDIIRRHQRTLVTAHDSLPSDSEQRRYLQNVYSPLAKEFGQLAHFDLSQELVPLWKFVDSTRCAGGNEGTVPLSSREKYSLAMIVASSYIIQGVDSLGEGGFEQFPPSFSQPAQKTS